MEIDSDDAEKVEFVDFAKRKPDEDVGPPLGSLVIVGKDNNSIGLYEIYSIDEVSFVQHDRINFVDMGPKQIAFCRGVSCVFILPMTGVK